MFAYLLMSAALSAAQPVPEAGSAVGPLQSPTATVAQAREEDLGYQEQSLKPLNVDMSDMSDGAELKVRAAKLKLKVPI